MMAEFSIILQSLLSPNNEERVEAEVYLITKNLVICCVLAHVESPLTVCARVISVDTFNLLVPRKIGIYVPHFVKFVCVRVFLHRDNTTRSVMLIN